MTVESSAWAADVAALLLDRGETLACAESLTGGALSAAIVDVPGASAVFRGGVVSYAASVKSSVLGVDPALIDVAGTVDPRVAEAMAIGVCRVVGSDWSIATTGVAGPGPAEGKEAGTAYVAVAGPDVKAGTGRRVTVRELRVPGGRAEVRMAVVLAGLSELCARLESR